MMTIYYRNPKSMGLQTIEEFKSGSWIHLTKPSETTLVELSDELDLDFDMLNDANDLYELPRIEQDGKNLYVYTRYSNPGGKEIATEPLLIVHTPDYVITVNRSESNVLDGLIGGKILAITTQRTQMLLQILEAINSSYKKHMYTIGKHILAIRGQLHKSNINNEVFVSFIDIEEDLNEILSALQAQKAVLRALVHGKYLKLDEDDRDLVEDLSLGTAELIELAQSRLKTISNTREAYSTIMANTLNKTFRLLTSIGIFMTLPVLLTSLYGMNVQLPLANNAQAFWILLVIACFMTLFSIWVFKKLRLL